MFDTKEKADGRINPLTCIRKCVWLIIFHNTFYRDGLHFHLNHFFHNPAGSFLQHDSCGAWLQLRWPRPVVCRQVDVFSVRCAWDSNRERFYLSVRVSVYRHNLLIVSCFLVAFLVLDGDFCTIFFDEILLFSVAGIFHWHHSVRH